MWKDDVCVELREFGRRRLPRSNQYVHTNTIAAYNAAAVTPDDNLTVTGNASVANGNVATLALKSTGTPGIRIRSSADTELVKIWDSGTADFSGNVNLGRTLSVTNFFPARPHVGFLCTTTSGVASINYHVGFKTTGISTSRSANGVYTITIRPYQPIPTASTS